MYSMMKVKLGIVLVLAVGLIVAAIACGAEEDPTATPRPQTVAPTATTAPPTPVPTTAPEPTVVPTQAPTATPELMDDDMDDDMSMVEYPLTVTDMLGRPVTIAEPPQRIASISPTTTEFLYAVGGTAVVRDSSSRYPPEVNQLPDVGPSYTPSMELLAEQTPDLILFEGLTQGRHAQALAQIGVPVVGLQVTSLQDVYDGIDLVGMIVDQQEAAEALKASIAERIEAATTKVPEGTTMLILIPDEEQNLYAAKPTSYTGAIAAELGFVNPAADMADGQRFSGFALLPPEQLAITNPDYIFTITPAPPPAPRFADLFVAFPGANFLNAVRMGNVNEIDATLFIQAPGPRFVDAVESMAELVGG